MPEVYRVKVTVLSAAWSDKKTENFAVFLVSPAMDVSAVMIIVAARYGPGLFGHLCEKFCEDDTVAISHPNQPSALGFLSYQQRL